MDEAAGLASAAWSSGPAVRNRDERMNERMMKKGSGCERGKAKPRMGATKGTTPHRGCVQHSGAANHHLIGDASARSFKPISKERVQARPHGS